MIIDSLKSSLTEALLRRARSAPSIPRLNGVPDLQDSPDLNGAVFIIEEKETGKILICYEEKKQKRMRLGGIISGLQRWGFPGGGKRNGEHIVDTAKRELEEETGLKARQLTFTLIGRIPLFRDPTLRTLTLYTVISQQMVVSMKKGGELTKWKWVSKRIIDFMIAKQMFLPNHSRYWRIAKFLLAKKKKNKK